MDNLRSSSSRRNHRSAPVPPHEAAAWTVLRACSDGTCVALRVDVAGHHPVECTLPTDALAAFHLISLGAGRLARDLQLGLLLREASVPWPRIGELLGADGALLALTPAFEAAASDLVTGWGIDLTGASYDRGGRRHVGRSCGLGTGRSWRPRLLLEHPVYGSSR